VRRLFSTFARGWPGVGLLLIRIAAGVSLMIDGFEKFQTGEDAASLVLSLLAVGDGALLIAGLWTPIAGSLVIGLAIWQTMIRHENPYPGILLAAMGAALALVGPGALSIDAWLFGWKRIDIGN
jgi:putative oxidoreductase